MEPSQTRKLVYSIVYYTIGGAISLKARLSLALFVGGFAHIEGQKAIAYQRSLFFTALE